MSHRIRLFISLILLFSALSSVSGETLSDRWKMGVGDGFIHENTFAAIIRGRALAYAKLGPNSLAREYFAEWRAHADTLLWYEHLREIDSLKQAGFLDD